MFYKRIVVYIPDERTYKALRHKLVDDGLSLNALVLKLIRDYIDGRGNKPVGTKVTAFEAEFREKEAEDFDKAMPKHSRPEKGPAIEPVEMSVRAYEKEAMK